MGKNPITAAAKALKSAGPTSSVKEQVESVSNALVGKRRIRKITGKEKTLPKEAKSVLKNIQVQVSKAPVRAPKPGESDEPYYQYVEDLAVLEKFAGRLIEHYHSSGKKLSKKVQQTLVQARSEAVTVLALKKIQERILGLEERYRSDPQMSREEYKREISGLSMSVRLWKEKLLSEEPDLRDSPVLRRRITQLNTELESAFEISELQEHPGIVGTVALKLLRVSSNMIQDAKTQFEVYQAIEVAKDANENLSKSGESFQEEGRPLNTLIEQNVVSFVDRQLRSLKTEIKEQHYYIFPRGHSEHNMRVAERLLQQKERLVAYHRLAMEWAGPQKEDFEERIAILFEKVSRRAERVRRFFLDEAATMKEQKKVLDIADVAAKFRYVARMGDDEIKPSEIFGERSELGDRIQVIVKRLPDPALHSDAVVSLEKLGLLYRQVVKIKEEPGHTAATEKMLATVLERIEHYLSKQKEKIDIFREIDVRSEYFMQVKTQEFERFMRLLGMQPEATYLGRYSEYPNLSQYPFDEDDLLGVITNNRILDSFLRGKYGEISRHPLLLDASERYYEELDAHCEKVFLTLVQQLGLSVLQPPTFQTIEDILESRMRDFPDTVREGIKSVQMRIRDRDLIEEVPEKDRKAVQELQELWVMLDYLKYPAEMRRLQFTENSRLEFVQPYSDQMINECKGHKQMAEDILHRMVKENFELCHRLLVKSIPMVFQEAERITLIQAADDIQKLNKSDQFRYDHERPEALPLYVEGLSERREEDVDIHERLLKLTENDSKWTDMIEQYATHSFFDALLDKNTDLHELFCGFPGFSQITLQMDDRTQFLTIDTDKKEALLVGYGQLKVLDSLTQTSESEDVRRITVKVAMTITPAGGHHATITFTNKTLSICVFEYKDEAQWGLLSCKK